MYFATGFEIPLAQLESEGFTANSATISSAQSHKDLSGNGGSSSLYNGAFNIFSLPASGDQNDKKWLSFAMRCDTISYFNISIIDSLGYTNALVRIGNTSSSYPDLTIFRGNASTSLATTTSPFIINNWYWVDIEVKIHDSTGIISVYINGEVTPTLTYSGNTKFYANDGFSKVSFYSFSGGVYYDDIILSSESDGRPAYECFMKLISPNAAGSHTGLTPSAGSNYQCVDEATPSDVDYNEAAAADDYDLYNFTSLGYNPIAIKGVVLHTRAAKDGIITRARAKCLSNGVGADGSYVTLGSSYTTNQQIFPLNPDGSVDWTETTVNAAEFGIQFDEAT